MQTLQVQVQARINNKRRLSGLQRVFVTFYLTMDQGVQPLGGMPRPKRTRPQEGRLWRFFLWMQRHCFVIFLIKFVCIYFSLNIRLTLTLKVGHRPAGANFYENQISLVLNSTPSLS